MIERCAIGKLNDTGWPRVSMCSARSPYRWRIPGTDMNIPVCNEHREQLNGTR
jgi:hypothetical protein